MPIVVEVNAVLFEDKNPKEALSELMLRVKKEELEDRLWDA
jgi:glycerol-3-phosphate dehydrogenase (NAD(P)+)